MSMIHLNRDRASLGQFSPEDIAEGLQQGRFRPTDLAWREGMESWLPLSQFPDLPPVPPPAPDEPPAFAPGAELLSSLPPESILPSWEANATTDFLTRTFATIQEVLGKPGETFSRLSQSPSILPPLWFLILISTVTNLVAFGYQIVFARIKPELSNIPNEMLEFPMIIFVFVAAAILMPVAVTLGAFVSAGLYHLGLMITGSTKEGFRTTFRVTAYVQGATAILLLIPFCGQIFQVIWVLILMVIGLEKAQRSTTGSAVIAVAVALLLGCGLALAAYMLIIGGVFALTGMQSLR